MTPNTNQFKEVDERFDEQYEPYPHVDDISSRWKYGAPSPISIKRFLHSELKEERKRVLQEVLETLTEQAEPYDGSKWHNTLTIKQIKASITKQLEK